MSIVCYDGKTIAADRQATHSDMRYATTKMKRLPSGEILAWTGYQDLGLMMVMWYEQGAVLDKWPESQKDKEKWSPLIVVCSRSVKVFEQEPVAFIIEDPFMAWGAGVILPWEHSLWVQLRRKL